MMRIDFDAMRRTLRRSANRRVGLAVGVVGAGVVGLLALESRSGPVPEPDKAACCSSAVAVGDSMMAPAVGGDKDFFEVPSSPPSAIFLLGNNDTMQDFPTFLPEVNPNTRSVPSPTAIPPGDFGAEGWAGLNVGTGCTDPALVSAMSWFDKNSTNPNVNGSVPFDADADFGATPMFFDPNVFYQSRGRRVSMVVNEANASMSWDFRLTDGNTDAWSACYRALDWKSEYSSSPVANECISCLGSVGWWRGPIVTQPTSLTDPTQPDASNGHDGPGRAWDEPPLPPEAYRKWVVSGRVLNVRPPKLVIARKVLKDVINIAPNVRMGVATFGPDQGWYDPPQVLEKLRPSCDQSFPTINETALDRPTLMKSVNKVIFRNNERSIGEALFGLGGYFSSQLVDGKWLGWFQQPLDPGWGWPGCCNGGTYDNPNPPHQEGIYWGVQSDEWVKAMQPWEDPDPVTNRKSVCFGCQVNSVIVLTDGAPKYDNSVPITKMMQLLLAKGARHPDGSLVTFDSTDPEHNPNVGGINYCDQFVKDEATGTKFTKADCDYTDFNWPTGLGVGNKNFMDDVAYFLANMDLRDDMPGTQSVRTYTIGYGDNSAMLQSIALAGKGKFYPVNDPGGLRDAIISALGDIKELSTSFASANISGVQTGGQSAVYVPRFVPRRGRPYEGHLYRFFFYNEFAQGCDETKAKSTAGDPYDLNRDQDCEDSFFVDKPAGFSGGAPNVDSFTADNIVQENTDGVWVKVNTATPVEGGKVQDGTPAQPFWDFGETLGQRSASLPCDPSNPLGPTSGRCLFTLIDRDNDGKFTEADNPPVEFRDTNVATLRKYLLAGGDSFCITLYAKQKKGTWTGSDADLTACASELIRFVRGMDIFDYDGDPATTEIPCADDKTKSCKLADIFHSTPVTVEPPAEPLLCTLGLSGQCVATLYDDLSTSVSSERLCSAPGGSKPCYQPTPLDPPRSASKKYGAYDDYKNNKGTRERIALVGSNGGMLHAIHVGSPITSKVNPLDDIYDMGTGQEMWAFIPPDLLPKLGLMVAGHEYFVDGTPMVRDIWTDGLVNKDGKKQEGEFRTIGVITERGGGQRYVALDLTDPREMLKGASARPFRWMFPDACSKESVSMGQSWSNFAPKPPPIGPVRLAAGTGSTAADTSRGWEERWVAVLNGGYSADLSRGRGVYMVDAWTGKKLWSAEAHPTTSAPSSYQAVLNQMMPIAAAPSLVDVGKAENVQLDLDGFFDTMVVGDLGGQVWTFRFQQPGTLDATTNLVTNWFGARSLEMARDDGSSNGPRNGYQKLPFFNVASNVLQPETGWLRSFVGTGDRQHLRTSVGTDCGPDDLMACVRLKCDVKAVFSGNVNGLVRTNTIQYTAGVLVTHSEGLSGALSSACTGSKMELTSLDISCPDATALGTGTYSMSTTTQSSCALSSSQWTCTQSRLNASTHGDLKLTAADKTAIPNHRYFGFHSYGGWQRKFTDSSGAVTFDKLRVTDTPSFNCGTGATCSLVDVTLPDSSYKTYMDPDGNSVRYVPVSELSKMKRGTVEGPGWFLRYSSLQERTSAGSAVLAGVVFWPSFAPAAAGGSTACSLSGAGDQSYSWQADAITGMPDQSEGFRLRDDKGDVIGYLPNKGRSTNAPPSEPAPIVAVSKSGGIRYEVAVTSPGDAPKTEKLADQKNVSPDIYWLEVPRNLHECRHENADACK